MQKFNLCGLAYDRMIPSPYKQKIFSLELPNQMNLHALMPVHMGLEPMKFVSALKCVIYKPFSETEEFYIILDPNNKYSIFVASLANMYGTSEWRLWLTHYFYHILNF